MPATRVHFYAEANGINPVLEWLERLARRDPRAFGACRERVVLPAALGHELRPPHADMLRDGIYELRSRVGSVNYRLLYFFHGRDVAIVAHGLTKEAEVPRGDIQKAAERKAAYERAPERHRATREL